MGWYKKCPECEQPMDVSRDEYEALCLHCMIAVGMPRSAYNDMKKIALTFEGDEDAFAASFMSYGRDMARRAFRKAKASG